MVQCRGGVHECVATRCSLFRAQVTLLSFRARATITLLTRRTNATRCMNAPVVPRLIRRAAERARRDPAEPELVVLDDARPREAERVEPERREEEARGREPERPRALGVLARLRVAREQQQRGAHLGADVEVRAREEAELLVERRVARHEAAAGRAVRRAAREQRLLEVVRARLDVEDEVERAAREEHVRDLEARGHEPLLEHERGEQRQRVEHSHPREQHLDRSKNRREEPRG